MRHRTTSVVIAAVLAVALVGTFVALATAGSDDETPGRVATARSRATTTTVDTSVRCGTELPMDFAIPAGFRGPVRSVARDAPPLEPGQLSLLWTSPDASVEVRWPGDAEIHTHFSEMDPPSPIDTMAIVGPDNVLRRTASGTALNEMIFIKQDQAVGCQFLQLRAYGSDDGVTRTVGALAARPFVSHIPLITGSEDVVDAPAAGVCRTLPGVESPNEGGPVNGAVFTNPQDAFEAFIAADRSLFQTGYVQLDLADRSFAYGHRDPRGEFWVTVIHVARVPGGWAVDHWDASGC